MRVMALDFGEARTGVAISDLTGLLAGETFVLDRAKLVERVTQLASERGVESIVVGYPKHMNGSVGERAQASETLAQKLREATGLPVRLWDERQTTMAAERILRGKKKKRGQVDAVAAALILESYLASLRRSP